MHTAFIKELTIAIQGDVLTSPTELGLYSMDASIYQIMPIVVVLPAHEEDVVLAVSIASKYNTPVLPRGGGTSLGGQVLGKAMVLDFSKYMNEILEINVDEKYAIVQPGVIRDQLNDQLKKDKLHFAPDPATTSRANIGGMIGNNSSGTKSILYGKTIDHVIALKVLLSDGTILWLESTDESEWFHKERSNSKKGQLYKSFRSIIEDNRDEVNRKFPTVMRRVSGYNMDAFTPGFPWNLSHIFVGSEGTLGTILQAKIHLTPTPEYRALAVIHFQKLNDSLMAVRKILHYNPSAVELLNDSVIELSTKNLMTQSYCHFVVGKPEALLLVEFFGESQSDAIEKAQHMTQALRQSRVGYAHPVFPEGKKMNDVWTVRKKGLGLLLSVKTDKKPIAFIEDAMCTCWGLARLHK